MTQPTKQPVQSEDVIVFPKKAMAKFRGVIVPWEKAVEMGGRLVPNAPIYRTFGKHFNEETNAQDDFLSGTGGSREGEFVMRRMLSQEHGYIAGLHQQNW